MNKPFIDIHTHSPSKKGEWVIENVYKDFDRLPASFFSAGLHPWFIHTNTWEQELKILASISSNTKMLALGECGLDRICDTDYALQQTVFAAQIKLANQLKKPLILHCVRAYEDTIHLLEKQQNSMPVIFHGFNKGLAMAQKLVAKNYHLSFGQAIERPHIQEIFSSLPLQNIFLETDDAAISIETVYKTAAAARGISEEALSLQLQQNAEQVFNTRV